ncbi:MAG: RHS repeat-associated core domain-containing protein [Planctomycetota bacterium]|nr:MAG: RHS repeat-associated core domain-containing protein [Planctomycetota bacterium]REK18541.1 MAG: RHS repeat-associated core domain-containing protein [Planctomycetota bacterium]REK39508.1 MAG: RHS repeat-associated core domain-containing protein [Planctomycetota bacterium]
MGTPMTFTTVATRRDAFGDFILGPFGGLGGLPHRYYVAEWGYYPDLRFSGSGAGLTAHLVDNYVRARTYDPVIARWLSRDPLGFAAGDYNLYRYVGNRVVIAIDPSGLQDSGNSQLDELGFDDGSIIDDSPRSWDPQKPPRLKPFGVISREMWNTRLRQIRSQHEGYAYGSITGILQFIDRLTADVTPHLYFDIGGAKGTTGSARYQWWIDTVQTTYSIPNTPLGDVLHESVHAYNDFRYKIQMTQDKDEALATALEQMIERPFGMRSLQLFEEAIEKGEYGSPVQCCKFGLTLQGEWDKIWDRTLSTSIPAMAHPNHAPTSRVAATEQTRRVNNNDFLNVTTETGVKVSCSELAKIYSSMTNCVLICPNLANASAFA